MIEATQKKLVEVIIASPDDDGARLVYADSLTERGDPRGEFINLQLRLAGRINPARRRELRDRETQLLAAHGQSWLAPATDVGLSAIFRRGFIEEVRGPASGLAKAKALLEFEPVQVAKLVDGHDADLTSMVRTGVIGKLRQLRIATGAIGDSSIIELANAPEFASLRILNLADNNIGDDGLVALAGSPHFALTALTLNSNDVGDRGLTALTEAPLAKSLTALFLARNNVGDLGVRSVAESAHLVNLRELGLGQNHSITDVGAAHLATAELAARIHRLELNAIDFTSGSTSTANTLRTLWGKRVLLY